MDSIKAQIKLYWKMQLWYLALLECIYNPITVGFPLSRDFTNFQVPELLDFFSPGTTGPSRSLGPVLSSPGT